MELYYNAIFCGFNFYSAPPLNIQSLEKGGKQRMEYLNTQCSQVPMVTAVPSAYSAKLLIKHEAKKTLLLKNIQK